MFEKNGSIKVKPSTILFRPPIIKKQFNLQRFTMENCVEKKRPQDEQAQKK